MRRSATYAPAPDTESALPFEFRALERASEHGGLSGLASALMQGGLRPDALRPVLGIPYANRMQIETLEAPEPSALQTLREALLWLFVAGVPVPRALIEASPGGGAALLDPLECLGFAASRGPWVVPNLSILPVAGQLILCDPPNPLEGEARRDVVAAPDLSAYHLIAQIARRNPRTWIDVATGTGVVGLAGRGAPGLLLGTDLNDRALAFAQASSWLNAANETCWRCGDLFDAGGPRKRWQLVTCNPPLVEATDDDSDLPLYLAGAAGLLERFWREVPDWVDPDGEVVTHSALPEDAEFPRSLGLAGSFAVCRYSLGGEPFCITRWRPRGRDALQIRSIPRPERPAFGP